MCNAGSLDLHLAALCITGTKDVERFNLDAG